MSSLLELQIGGNVMKFKSSIFAKYLSSIYKTNLSKTNKIHKILIDSIFKCFVMVEDDIDQMALEMCLSTATGQWLDLWGDYFGIPRRISESDKSYSHRIIDEIIQPKATLTALKSATARWLNYIYDSDIKPEEIEIKEPWKDLLVTSHRGRVSYFGRLPDSEYWTPAVIDIAIPDSSQMSADLIAYLNEVKAAGVQISWHITMDWETVVGYFGSDKVLVQVEHWYDIWVKRENQLGDAFRTSCEWTYLDSEYFTPLSVSGFISGRRLSYFDLEQERELLPFRLTTNVVHCNPIINIEDLATFAWTTIEDLTIKQACDLEFKADRQIPNSDKIGKSLWKELHEYSRKNVGILKKDFEDMVLTEISEQLSLKNVKKMKSEFSGNKDKQIEVMETWNTLNYFNKPINTNSLAIYAGPLKILVEEDID